VLARRLAAALALCALFALGGCATARQVPVQVGPARTLTAGLLGFNGEALTAPAGLWSSAAFRRAVAALHPQAIRVFGGTPANYWDWRTGTFVRGPVVPAALAAERSHVHVTLADWAALVRASGAEPIYDLNLFTSTLGGQLAMLRTARSLGMPVRFVELGNELYAGPYRSRFPSGAAYGRVATRWAAALHADFPGVQVAAVADPGGDVNLPGPPGGVRAWNQGLGETLRGVNALTFHVYFASGLGRRQRPTRGTAATRLLAAAAQRWAELAPEIDRSPLPTWITEWNLFDQRAAVAETWAQGLAVAELGIEQLADPHVTQSDNHALVASAPFGALFDGRDGLSLAGSGFAAAEHRAPPTRLYGVSADGVAMATLLSVLVGGRQLAPIAFTGGLGAMVTGGAHARAVLADLSPHTLSVQLPAALQGLVAGTVSADPASVIDGVHSLRRASARSGAQLTLPAYSLTVLGVGS
jgi:hypothetical protein